MKFELERPDRRTRLPGLGACVSGEHCSPLQNVRFLSVSLHVRLSTNIFPVRLGLTRLPGMLVCVHLRGFVCFSAFPTFFVGSVTAFVECESEGAL